MIPEVFYFYYPYFWLYGKGLYRKSMRVHPEQGVRVRAGRITRADRRGRLGVGGFQAQRAREGGASRTVLEDCPVPDGEGAGEDRPGAAVPGDVMSVKIAIFVVSESQILETMASSGLKD